MQFKMRQITFNILPERDQFGFAALPLVFESRMIDIPDYVYQMPVHIFPKHNQILPIFVLKILNGNPAIIVSVSGIIGVGTGVFTVLKMYNPVGIIGSRIDQMTQYLPDTAVLTISSLADYFFGK
jgi:hypothetical protein